MTTPRFEIDRKKDKKTGDWHYYARYIARNGKEVWRTSEVYTRPENVRRAIISLGSQYGYPVHNVWSEKKSKK